MSHVSVVRMIDLFLSVPKFNNLTGLVKSLFTGLPFVTVCFRHIIYDLNYM